MNIKRAGSFHLKFPLVMNYENKLSFLLMQGKKDVRWHDP